jgi:uncharacterized LabA/DUF88 family protein
LKDLRVRAPRVQKHKAAPFVDSLPAVLNEDHFPCKLQGYEELVAVVTRNVQCSVPSRLEPAWRVAGHSSPPSKNSSEGMQPCNGSGHYDIAPTESRSTGCFLYASKVRAFGDWQRTMDFSPTERVALFIDGANLYAATKSLGFDIDYKRLLTLFRERAQLLRALYYTALIDGQEYSSLRPLLDWLEYNGFTVVTKPAKEFTDASGRRKIKGNMDIELAVDALQLADRLDHIVIFSGDGDFRSLVAALQQMGKRVSVISTMESQPPMIADELRRQADQFIDLVTLEPTIRREGSMRPVHPAAVALAPDRS